MTAIPRNQPCWVVPEALGRRIESMSQAINSVLCKVPEFQKAFSHDSTKVRW